MPNWCENILTINGPAEEIHKFKKFVGLNGKIVFDNIIPMPEDLIDNSENCLPSWYWWRCENWGTKWEPRSLSVIEEDVNHIQLKFETANTPPIPIVRTLCEKFQKLQIELLYLEFGNELAGHVSNFDEDVQEHEIYDSEEYRLFSQEHFGLELEDENEDQG